MAINCYIGLMGSGKSYEVVTNVIVPALAKGRRVVTNIYGMNFDAIRDYLVNEKDLSDIEIGHLELVTSEDVEKGGFYPSGSDDFTARVHPGDLVVLDESWRFYGTANNHTRRDIKFFTEHRHYVNDKGHTCDLVLIVQDLALLDRSLARLIELTVRTKKLKALGLSKQYVCHVYEPRPRGNSKPDRTIPNTYNPKFFAFYSSYDRKNAKEQQVDKRQNLLRSPLIIYGMPTVLAFFAFSYYSLSSFFAGPKPQQKSASSLSPSSSTPAQVVRPPEASEQWRVVGTWVRNNYRYVLLRSATGYRTLYEPMNWDFKTTAMPFGRIDGALVTEYSGSVPGVSQSLATTGGGK